jgi:membrane protein DedA with SNARE-associated domain
MDHVGILELLARYGSALMFGLVLLDNAGLPLPGEPFLIAFGSLAADGRLDLTAGFLAAALGALAGDTVSHWVGRIGGDRVLRGSCRFTPDPSRCVERAVGFYRRFGSATLVLGRFLVGLRALVVVLAGSTGVPFWKFLIFDVIGAALWSGLFIGAGYALGDQEPALAGWVRGGSALVAATLAAGLGACLAVSAVRGGRIRWGIRPLRSNPRPVSPCRTARG